jgi:pyruvate/2-oxoglutarate dehydrogenase complex dihydrolipoamide acyltransferase (E2) component
VLAKILRPAGTGESVPVGTPIMVTVDDAKDVAAFAGFVAPGAAAAPAPKAAAAAPAPPPPPPPPAPAAPAPAARASTPAPAAPAAGEDDGYAGWPAWGQSLSRSPLGEALLAKQRAYTAEFGFAGVALSEEPPAAAPQKGKK